MNKNNYQSQSSLLTLDSSKGESFSKFDETIFNILYPLYKQKNYPRKGIEALIWLVQFLQLFSLAFFCIDTKTNEETSISYV